MARTRFQLDGFAGLNQSSPPHMLNDKELPVCQNFRFGKEGELIKRPGMKYIRATGATSQPSFTDRGVRAWTHRASTGESQIWVHGGGGLRKSDNEGAFTSITFAPHYFAATWADVYDGKLYLGNNSSGVAADARIVRVDGNSTLVSLANSPVDTLDGVFHKNRLFVIDGKVSENQIRWSDAPGDPAFPTPFTDWPATNTWVVGGTQGADVITKLVSFNDILYIFKRETIWALHVQGDSPANWTLRLVSSNFGCSSPRGVLAVDNNLYFLANTSLNVKALVRTDGYTFQILSEPVENLLNVNPLLDFSNFGYAGLTPVKYEDNIIFLKWELSEGPPEVGPQTILCYNYKRNIWSTWYVPNHFVTVFLEGYSQPANSWVVYAFGLQPGIDIPNLYRFSDITKPTDLVFTDQALGYQSKFRTKEWVVGAEKYQRIFQAFIDYDSASGIDARYVTEVGTTELPVAAAGGARSSIKVAGPQICRRVSYEFDDASAVNECRIFGFGMHLNNNAYQGKAKVS